MLFYTDGQGQAEGTLDGAIHMYTRVWRGALGTAYTHTAKFAVGYIEDRNPEETWQICWKLGLVLQYFILAGLCIHS